MELLMPPLQYGLLDWSGFIDWVCIEGFCVVSVYLFWVYVLPLSL